MKLIGLIQVSAMNRTVGLLLVLMINFMSKCAFNVLIFAYYVVIILVTDPTLFAQRITNIKSYALQRVDEEAKEQLVAEK